MSMRGHRTTPSERSHIGATSEPHDHADASEATLGPVRLEVLCQSFVPGAVKEGPSLYAAAKPCLFFLEIKK